MKAVLLLAIGLLLADPCQASDTEPGGLLFGQGPGNTAPLHWRFKGVDASLRDGALHLAVAAGQRGIATTADLQLEPLRLYKLTLESRRGPGCGLSVAVSFFEADGKPALRNVVFQLAGRPRPNSWPLAPFRQQYVQQFCLPPVAHEAILQVSLSGHPEAGLNFVDFYALSLTAGASVPFGAGRGSNLLHWDDLRCADDRGGLPPGWGTWVHRPEKLEFVPAGAKASYLLRIGPGQNFILAAPPVPIEPGRAYLVSFRVRGKADLGIGVHALEGVNDYPLRVGDPQAKSLRSDADAGTKYEFSWFAESLYAASGQLFISVNSRTELILSDISLQRIDH